VTSCCINLQHIVGHQSMIMWLSNSAVHANRDKLAGPDSNFAAGRRFFLIPNLSQNCQNPGLFLNLDSNFAKNFHLTLKSANICFSLTEGFQFSGKRPYCRGLQTRAYDNHIIQRTRNALSHRVSLLTAHCHL
jgi:hypothetical protein